MFCGKTFVPRIAENPALNKSTFDMFISGVFRQEPRCFRLVSDAFPAQNRSNERAAWPQAWPTELTSLLGVAPLINDFSVMGQGFVTQPILVSVVTQCFSPRWGGLHDVLTLRRSPRVSEDENPYNEREKKVWSAVFDPVASLFSIKGASLFARDWTDCTRPTVAGCHDHLSIT